MSVESNVAARNRLLIMIRDFDSYCDEYGHPDDPNKKFMGIAGLLGWSDKWGAFTDQWEELARVENIPKPFHMTDFVHHTEKFSDGRWENQEERIRILNLLLRVIEGAEVIPVGAAVVLKDYNELTFEQQRACRSPYYLAFQAVTSNMGFAAASMDLGMKVAKAQADVEAEKANLPIEETDYVHPAKISMVYAKLRGFTGPAEDLWKAIRNANMFGHWMSSYTIGDPTAYPPLQAADIWAYSLGHMGEHHSLRKAEAETAFKCFVQLAMKAAHGHHWFSLFDRKRMLLNLGQFTDI
jgi:hypothetical protein